MSALSELFRFACPGMSDETVQACARIIEGTEARRGTAAAAQVARAIAEGWNGIPGSGGDDVPAVGLRPLVVHADLVKR